MNKMLYHHIFFHSLIVEPELAFAGGKAVVRGFETWMITVSEYKAILNSLYERNYVLVKMADLLHGQAELPENKIPLVISFDDVNYYNYMKGYGFADKLVVDENGRIANLYIHRDGRSEVTTQADGVPILEEFIKEHPDFSFRGARGIIAVTGYEGVLGYHDPQNECEELLKVVETLKKAGWEFACHSFGHAQRVFKGSTLVKKQYEEDTRQWLANVVPYVGETDIYISPFGFNTQKFPEFAAYLKEQGFRYFCGVNNSRSYEEKDGMFYFPRVNIDGYIFKHRREEFERYYAKLEDILDAHRTKVYASQTIIKKKDNKSFWKKCTRGVQRFYKIGLKCLKNSVPCISRNVRYYNQWSARYLLHKDGQNYIGVSGNGPFTCAMVAASLLREKLDPVLVAKWARKNSYYISDQNVLHSIVPNFFEELGLECIDLGCSVDEMDKHLSAGNNLAVLLCHKGVFSKGNHFVVVEKRKNRFRIYNSCNVWNSFRRFDKSQIESLLAHNNVYIGPIWCISKSDTYNRTKRLEEIVNEMQDCEEQLPEIYEVGAAALAQHAEKCLKLPTVYLWDGLGQLITEKVIEEGVERYPEVYTEEYCKHLREHIGKNTYGFDCSGLIKNFIMGGLENFQLDESLDYNSSMLLRYSEKSGEIRTLPEIKGVCLYMPGHVGIYMGNGRVIEATRNIKFGDGVVETALKDRKWTDWFFCPGIQYDKLTEVKDNASH